MTLVYDKDYTLGLGSLELREPSFVFCQDVELLDRGNNKAIIDGFRFEFCHEDIRVFCLLYLLTYGREVAILSCRLRPQLDAVNDENDLVGMSTRGNELSRLEARERFATPRSVPDEASQLLVFALPVPTLDYSVVYARTASY